MKILLLGATGRTGRFILQKAVEDGHDVTVIVRDPSKIEGVNVKIIEGTPYDKETVNTAINDCDVVIGTLNISRTSDNPWAKLRSPKDLISRSMRNVLDVADKSTRIITLSTLGAGDSKKDMPFIVNMMVSLSNLKIAFDDHTRQEELLAQSNTKWTIVRLPILTEVEGENEILINLNDDTRLNNKINRESVARFVLTILEDEQYYKKIVAISNA